MAERRMTPSTKETWRRIRQAVFDRMSVGFLVSDRVEADPCWPVAAQGEWDGARFLIQRNASAMPRAYVVPRAIPLPDQAGVVLPSLAGLNPRDSVVMKADPLAHLSKVPRQPFTPANWTSADPDRLEFVVDTRAPGLMVIADSWMPGWTATVDSHRAPVLRGNYAQRVIPLPEAGRHVIVMEYRPPGWLVGCAISAVAALVWMAVVIRRALPRSRFRPDAPPAARGMHRGLSPPARRGRIAPVRHPICHDPGER
jgi:hypothetical protein